MPSKLVIQVFFVILVLSIPFKKPNFNNYLKRESNEPEFLSA